MHCTRLSHAGLHLAHQNHTLLIDPGNFSPATELNAALSLGAAPSGLVITHEHADHWTPEHVAAIRAVAPGCPIFTTEATAQALEAQGVSGVQVVREGDTASVASFELSFYGGRHEVLHATIPPIDNVGVRVNETLAFGGDSLMRPPFMADVLGIPIGSPWSNIAQVMDFVLDARPRRAYLTHDGMLSARGLGLFTQRVSDCLASVGGELIEFAHVDSFAHAPTAAAPRPSGTEL